MPSPQTVTALRPMDAADLARLADVDAPLGDADRLQAAQEILRLRAELVRRINAHDELLACLKFAVRWHDKLTVGDIVAFKAAIANASRV